MKSAWWFRYFIFDRLKTVDESNWHQTFCLHSWYQLLVCCCSAWVHIEVEFNPILEWVSDVWVIILPTSNINKLHTSITYLWSLTHLDSCLCTLSFARVEHEFDWIYVSKSGIDPGGHNNRVPVFGYSFAYWVGLANCLDSPTRW